MKKILGKWIFKEDKSRREKERERERERAYDDGE
jgi:hypothetical protein